MKLTDMFPWPAERPAVPPNLGPCWLSEPTEEYLREVSGSARSIVEVGTWRGRSALLLLELNPEATIACVDTWLGSAEHFIGWRDAYPESEFPEMNPAGLFEQFVVNVWDKRSRIIPVRLDSWSGLRVLRHKQFTPDFVYLDGGHSYEIVSRDLAEITAAWPAAPVVCDDYGWDGVAQAVRECGRPFKDNGAAALIT